MPPRINMEDEKLRSKHLQKNYSQYEELLLKHSKNEPNYSISVFFPYLSQMKERIVPIKCLKRGIICIHYSTNSQHWTVSSIVTGLKIISLRELDEAFVAADFIYENYREAFKLDNIRKITKMLDKVFIKWAKEVNFYNRLEYLPVV